ncbi:heterocycloanthracin/sonorensin family bacteriocin, partial [Paenibacillus validus]|nr:heterocycloanthracin/sonorensin family bacteriocin [Paenibacillus validus]
MDDFKKELQQLKISEFQAGEMVPMEYQGQYDPARLCGFQCGGGGFRCGCGGFRCGCG